MVFIVKSNYMPTTIFSLVYHNHQNLLNLVEMDALFQNFPVMSYFTHSIHLLLKLLSSYYVSILYWYILDNRLFLTRFFTVYSWQPIFNSLLFKSTKVYFYLTGYLQQFILVLVRLLLTVYNLDSPLLIDFSGPFILDSLLLMLYC